MSWLLITAAAPIQLDELARDQRRHRLTQKEVEAEDVAFFVDFADKLSVSSVPSRSPAFEAFGRSSRRGCTANHSRHVVDFAIG
jgi:hypothetical protein